MSLINCPECGKEISEYAKECPSCGCPMEQIKVLISQKKKETTKHSTEKTINKVTTYTDSTEKYKQLGLEIRELLMFAAEPMTADEISKSLHKKDISEFAIRRACQLTDDIEQVRVVRERTNSKGLSSMISVAAFRLNL